MGRRAIAEVLYAATEPLTVDEITELVQRKHRDVAASTVYRTLETMAGAGAVEPVHFGVRQLRWQLSGRDEHLLRCERCGTVQPVPRQLFQGLCAQLEEMFGFRPDLGRFAVLGQCSTCRAATQQPTDRGPTEPGARTITN